MALEDGAVLAKLFSHIRTSDQIPTLLYAYQDLRQPHVRRVQQKDLSDLYFQCTPPGEVQQGRDDFMRAQRDAGRSPLAPAGADEEELPEWTEIKDVFGYDAEDDADNWWVEWGLLRERARGTDVKLGFVEPIAIRQGVSACSTTCLILLTYIVENVGFGGGDRIMIPCTCGCRRESRHSLTHPTTNAEQGAAKAHRVVSLVSSMTCDACSNSSHLSIVSSPIPPYPLTIAFVAFGLLSTHSTACTDTYTTTL